MHKWNFGFHKIQGISWQPEELRASHSEFFFVESISNETCDSTQLCRITAAFWSVIVVHMSDFTLSSTEHCHFHENRMSVFETWCFYGSIVKNSSLFWNDMLCLLLRRELFTPWYIFVSLLNKNMFSVRFNKLDADPEHCTSLSFLTCSIWAPSWPIWFHQSSVLSLNVF